MGCAEEFFAVGPREKWEEAMRKTPSNGPRSSRTGTLATQAKTSTAPVLLK